MFPAARFAGVLALAALLAFVTAVRAADEELAHDGVSMAKWIDIAQKDSSARKRALAVQALGKIWVVNRQNDRARRAITDIGRALNTDPSAAVRSQAALVLAGLRADDLKFFAKDLVSALGNEKESRVRKQIIQAMLKFPETCVLALEVPVGKDTGPLVAVLKDTEPGVRAAAAEAIALAGTQDKATAKSAAPGLVPLLKDEDKSVRMAAVYAMGRIQPEGASTVAETMAAMLATEKDDKGVSNADIRRELVTSMGLLSETSEPVVRALAAALFDADDEVRRRAARVLGTFGTAAGSAANDLFKVLTTEELKDIRVDAVRAFGSALGPAGVKSRLKDLREQLDPAKQPNFEVRLALVEEIGALGWEHLGKELPQSGKGVKSEATETLVALRGRLADPQVKVREAAAVAIKKIQTKPEPKKEPEKKK